MKYCYECGRLTAGQPLFCNFCGRSYDVKLCSGKHANPRIAEVCSQCGSRDLSTPQPKVPLWTKFVEVLIRLLVGALLACLSLLLVAAMLQELLSNAQLQNGLIAIGILLGLLWWMWSKLPEWFRKTVRGALKRKERDYGHR